MTAAILGFILLITGLLNVGPVPSADYALDTDSQRRVLSQQTEDPVTVQDAVKEEKVFVPQLTVKLGAQTALLGSFDLVGLPGHQPLDVAAGQRAGIDARVPKESEVDAGQHGAKVDARSSSLVAKAPVGHEVERDPIISGKGPAVDNATLHGGWRLTDDIFHRASRHPSAVVVSHEKPYIVQYKHFLSQAEIDHLLLLSTDGFKRSGVVSEKSVNDQRTSYGVWLSGERRDQTVLDIQHRLHDWVGIPEAFGESLYMLRYEHGQKYDAHTDNCRHMDVGENLLPSCIGFLKRAGGPEYGLGAGGITGGDRLATLIMYIRAPEEGGQTVFPRASASQAAVTAERRRLLSAEDEDDHSTTPCEDPDTLRLSPEAGDAVLFWDYVPGEEEGRAVPDRHALHGGCAVTGGTKFIVTRWVRSTKFV